MGVHYSASAVSTEVGLEVVKVYPLQLTVRISHGWLLYASDVSFISSLHDVHNK